MVKIISLKRTGSYADGSPRYAFPTSLPSRNVRAVGDVHASQEDAHAYGKAAVTAYQASDPYGNMGEVCGVVEAPGGYRAVINTYYSST